MEDTDLKQRLEKLTNNMAGADGAFIRDGSIYAVKSKSLGIGLNDSSIIKSFSLANLTSVDTPEPTKLVLKDTQGVEVTLIGQEASIEALRKELPVE